jgi:transposase
MGVHMGKWLHDFSVSVADQLEPMLVRASGKGELRRIQAIYFRARFGDNAQSVAKRTGLTLGTVRNLHSRWRKEGEAALDLKPKGGRHHEYMTFEEERRWLHETFGEQAIAGGILEVSRIRRAYEEKVGRKVAHTTIYDLLHRHGWRKIAPRPHHPQANLAEQEAFKKTGRISLPKQNKKQRR